MFISRLSPTIIRPPEELSPALPSHKPDPNLSYLPHPNVACKRIQFNSVNLHTFLFHFLCKKKYSFYNQFYINKDCHKTAENHIFQRDYNATQALHFMRFFLKVLSLETLDECSPYAYYITLTLFYHITERL